MHRGEIKVWIEQAKEAWGILEYRDELGNARAVVLARHMGVPTTRGHIQQLAEAAGLFHGTVEHALYGGSTEGTYDSLAEGIGMSLAALDREAEALIAVRWRKQVLRELGSRTK